MTQIEAMSDAARNLLSDFEKRRERERQEAFAGLSEVCSQLEGLGVDRVVVTYDGYGDSGCVERVDAFAGESEVELDESLEGQLATAAERILPLGWENDAGAFGELILNVSERRVVLEHNWRIESCEYSEQEWQL